MPEPEIGKQNRPALTGWLTRRPQSSAEAAEVNEERTIRGGGKERALPLVLDSRAKRNRRSRARAPARGREALERHRSF